MLAINIQNNFNYNAKKQMSFGSLERTVRSASGKVRYKNNTYLFRPDLNWKSLINYIVKKGQPQKIYCYACSDGSEPYSIALSLVDKLGWEKAQAYFPIIARDIDKKVIQQANDRVIKLTREDIPRLKWFTKPENGIMFKYSGVRDCTSGVKFYFVDKKLAKCVNFSIGDLTSDSRTLDFKNSTLFFRNVWPYLSDAQQNILTRNFADRFDKTTSLVTGHFDEEKIALEKDIPHAFDDLMLKAGLWQVKPRIYEKHTLTNNPFNPINWGKIVANEYRSAFQNYLEGLKAGF